MELVERRKGGISVVMADGQGSGQEADGRIPLVGISVSD